MPFRSHAGWLARTTSTAMLIAGLVAGQFLSQSANGAVAELVKPQGGPAAQPLPANFNPVTPIRGDRVDNSVRRGIGFLMDLQTPEGILHDTQRTANYQTTVTSLSIMALAAAGHQPIDKTPEGLAMRRGLDYCLRTDRQEPNGSFAEADQSLMYGHGITTTMMTEVLAEGLDPEKEFFYRTRSRMALDLIVSAQRTAKMHLEDRGGWRYHLNSQTSDTSITAWQVLALWSGRRAGLTVPQTVFNAAATFVVNCFDGQIITYEHIVWPDPRAKVAAFTTKYTYEDTSLDPNPSKHPT